MQESNYAPMTDLPVYREEHFADGMTVCIVGTVEAYKEVAKAPMTERRCGAWWLEILPRGDTFIGGSRPLARDQKTHDFVCRTHSCDVLVDATSAKFLSDLTFVTSCGPMDPPSVTERALNQHYQLKVNPLQEAPQLTYREDVLLIGARVRGVVRPLATTVAPLTGRPCIAWRVSVVDAADASDMPPSVVVGGNPFELAMSDQALPIDMTHVSAAIKVSHRARSGAWHRPNRRAQAFLDAHGLSKTTQGGRPRRLRYEEGIIEAGADVEVAGLVQSTNVVNPGLAYRDRPADAWRLIGSKKHAC